MEKQTEWQPLIYMLISWLAVEVIAAVTLRWSSQISDNFITGYPWSQNHHINHPQTNATFDHCFRIKTKDIAIFHMSHNGSLPWDGRKKIMQWLGGLTAAGTAGVSLILFYLYVRNL